jgi:TRAP-type C4-dicarboxylate transport system permease small subunit
MYIICFSAPMAVKYGMFARVDIIFMLVPLKARLLLEVIASLFVVVFFVGLVFASWPLIALGGRRLSFAMQIPMVIFLITMPMLAVTSAIAAIGRIIFLINDFRNPERVIQREREAAEKQALENEMAVESVEKIGHSGSNSSSDRGSKS